VHAPHAPSEHPGLAPVRPRLSRTAVSSAVDPGTGTGIPLTVSVMLPDAPGAELDTRDRSAAGHRADDQQRLAPGHHRFG